MQYINNVCVFQSTRTGPHVSICDLLREFKTGHLTYKRRITEYVCCKLVTATCTACFSINTFLVCSQLGYHAITDYPPRRLHYNALCNSEALCTFM
jgi:hypothetical protein